MTTRTGGSQAARRMAAHGAPGPRERRACAPGSLAWRSRGHAASPRQDGGGFPRRGSIRAGGPCECDEMKSVQFGEGRRERRGGSAGWSRRRIVMSSALAARARCAGRLNDIRVILHRESLMKKSSPHGARRADDRTCIRCPGVAEVEDDVNVILTRQGLRARLVRYKSRTCACFSCLRRSWVRRVVAPRRVLVLPIR